MDVPRPHTSLKLPDVSTEPLTKQEKFNAYRQKLAIKRKQGEMYSLWCDALYRLSLANHVRFNIYSYMFYIPY